jgi:hypothetical protein
MKGISKRWMWPLTMAAVLALGSAQSAGAQPAPASDPASVLTAFVGAVGTDVDAAFAMAADDMVLRIVPAPQGTTGLWTGKDEVRQGLEYAKAHKVKITLASNPQVDGNRVTATSMSSNDFFEMIGVAPVQFTSEAVIVDGKIKSFTNTIAPSEGPRVGAAAQAFQAAHAAGPPAGMPKTGGNDVGLLTVEVVLVALLCIIGGFVLNRARLRA